MCWVVGSMHEEVDAKGVGGSWDPPLAQKEVWARGKGYTCRKRDRKR